jgi:hypothetical protein
LFENPLCYKRKIFVNIFLIIERYSVCIQRTKLEPAFYHGIGYISYALTIGLSIITFLV